MGFIVAVSAFIIPLIIFMWLWTESYIRRMSMMYLLKVQRRHENGGVHSSDTDWTDDGSWNFAGIRFPCVDFRKDRNTDRPVWDSLTDDSSDYRQNVQFFGGNGVITGFVPGIWNGFLHRTDYIHYDELYRNDILYNVGLFSGGKGAKDAVDACGSTCIDSSGNCSKCFSGTPDELKIKNGGLQEMKNIWQNFSAHLS